ncbi:UNVERIFIED_CONTAM: transmembrane protein, putative [Hammondia hammondi]|eukprot:XP_008888897.1 transmembrane protein, putative [Hammondia hammondi]
MADPAGGRICDSPISPETQRVLVGMQSRVIFSPSDLPLSASRPPRSTCSLPTASGENGLSVSALHRPGDEEEGLEGSEEEGGHEKDFCFPSAQIVTVSPPPSGFTPRAARPAEESFDGSFSVSCSSPLSRASSPSDLAETYALSSDSVSFFSLIGAAEERIRLLDRVVLLALVSLSAAAPHFFRHALTTFQLFFTRDRRLQYSDFSHGLLFSLLELPAVPASLLAGFSCSARHETTRQGEPHGKVTGSGADEEEGERDGGRRSVEEREEEDQRKERHEGGLVEDFVEEPGDRNAVRLRDRDAFASTSLAEKSGAFSLVHLSRQSRTLVQHSQRVHPYPSYYSRSPEMSSSLCSSSCSPSRSALPSSSPDFVSSSMAHDQASKRLLLSAALCWTGQLCFGISISFFAFLPGAWLSVVLAGAGGAALVVLQRSALVTLFPSSPAGCMAFSVACSAVAKTLGRVGPVFVASLLSHLPPHDFTQEREGSGEEDQETPFASSSPRSSSLPSDPPVGTGEFDYRGLVVGTTLVSGVSVLAAWGVTRVVRRLLIALLAQAATRQGEEPEEETNAGTRESKTVERKQRWRGQDRLAEPLLGSHTTYPERSKEDTRAETFREKGGDGCSPGHCCGRHALTQKDQAGYQSNVPSTFRPSPTEDQSGPASRAHSQFCPKTASSDVRLSFACFSSPSHVASSSSSASAAVASATCAASPPSTEFELREQPSFSVLSNGGRRTREPRERELFSEQATTDFDRRGTEGDGESEKGTGDGEERQTRRRRRRRDPVALCLCSSRQKTTNRNRAKKRPTERTGKILQERNLRMWCRQEKREVREKVGKLGREFWSLVILHALIVAVGHCFLSFSSSIFHRVYKASITHAAVYAALITVTTIVLLPALAYLIDRIGGSLLLVAVGMLLMWLVFCGTISLQPSLASSSPASSSLASSSPASSSPASSSLASSSPASSSPASFSSASSSPASSLEPSSSASLGPSLSASSSSLVASSAPSSRHVLPLSIGGVFSRPAGGGPREKERREESSWAALTAILLGCAEALLPTVLMALVADKVVVPDPALYDVAFALMEAAKSIVVAATDATFGFLVDRHNALAVIPWGVLVFSKICGEGGISPCFPSLTASSSQLSPHHHHVRPQPSYSSSRVFPGV